MFSYIPELFELYNTLHFDEFPTNLLQENSER